MTLSVTAADEGWNDVKYAVGALYCLAENGVVASGLAAGTNPRTAVGQKADGTLVFYTVDGRRSGHSIGASMTQVASGFWNWAARRCCVWMAAGPLIWR